MVCGTGSEIKGTNDNELMAVLLSKLGVARKGKEIRDADMREAKREAAFLWAVVKSRKTPTMEVIEAALERSPEKYAKLLDAVREVRDTLERTLALRRADVRQWRERLTVAVSERCHIVVAEKILAELSHAHEETLSIVRHEQAELEYYLENVAAAQVVRLRRLLADSVASIHTNVEPIYAAVEELSEASDAEVWGVLLELQLRAEEIEKQRREVELMRQRLVKLTGTAPLDHVEALLQAVRETPDEWQRALEHERSRLRAWYTLASHDISESLLRLIDRQDLEDLPLVEDALELCNGNPGYGHPLIGTALEQLVDHREHLVTVKKAALLREEYKKEATKRAAAEARHRASTRETEELEQKLKHLQKQLFYSQSEKARRAVAATAPAAAGGSSGGAAKRRRAVVCIICKRSFVQVEFEAHSEQCALTLRQRIDDAGGAVSAGVLLSETPSTIPERPAAAAGKRAPPPRRPSRVGVGSAASSFGDGDGEAGGGGGTSQHSRWALPAGGTGSVASDGSDETTIG